LFFSFAFPLLVADFNVTNVNYTDPHICENVCLANPNCMAWTYVTRPPLIGSCCQKNEGFGYTPNSDKCTSGVRKPQPAPAGGSFTDTLSLLPSDKTLELRIFVDNTFLEAYFMDGRVAMTATLRGSSPEAGVALFADNATVTAASVHVWHVNSIWVSPDDVVATPKRASV
jgi:hypothetical protein